MPRSLRTKSFRKGALRRIPNPGPSSRRPTPTFVQHCVLRVVKTVAIKRAKTAGRSIDGWMRYVTPADLSRAFAVCVAQGQRNGYLAPGTIEVTPRGKGMVTKHRRGALEQAKTAEYERLLEVVRERRAKVVALPRRTSAPVALAANPKRLGRRRNDGPRGFFLGSDGKTVIGTDLRAGIYLDGVVAPSCWVKEWAWDRDHEFLSKPVIAQAVRAWAMAECHPRVSAKVVD